jgi:glycerophosphoryl diester phosphodiesterase
VIQTFETAYLVETIQLAPDIPCYQLIVGALNFPPMYQDRSFHLAQFHPMEGVEGVVGYYQYLSEGFVRTLQAEKLVVGAFTVNEVEDVDRVVNLGVDLVITDDPELLVGIRRGDR